MRNIAFPNLLKTLREYVLMTAGLLIYSFGWIACIKPMEVAAGGGTGLAMIVSHTAAEMWGVDIRFGTVFLTINAFLLLLSGLTVGWNFGFKTLFCIVVASGFMALMEPYFMVHYPPSGDVLGLDDKLLTIILGALLAGAGMAVCFTAGGATGGTDIVAKIFHKYWGVAYGKVIIYTDILIIGSTLLVGYGLSDVVYGYIVTVVVGTSVDLLMAGSQQSNQIFIVTADYDRMAEAILHEADRGVTLIDATGGYSRHEIRIVMVVCYKRDAGHVLRIARDVDPKAFVTIASVSGTYGEGFRKLTQLRCPARWSVTPISSCRWRSPPTPTPSPTVSTWRRGRPWPCSSGCGASTRASSGASTAGGPTSPASRPSRGYSTTVRCSTHGSAPCGSGWPTTTSARWAR